MKLSDREPAFFDVVIARKLQVAGMSLTEIAITLGVFTQALDLALWDFIHQKPTAHYDPDF